jgi:hypothetical protein
LRGLLESDETLTGELKPIISDTGKVYRVDHPEKELAFVVVFFGKLLILDHIGPNLDCLEAEGDLEEQLQNDFDTPGGIPDGLYLWSGTLKVESSYDYDGEYDSTIWLEGEFVKATEENWKNYLEENSVWECGDWLVDFKTREAILEACEQNHELFPNWPPSRFKRAPVI